MRFWAVRLMTFALFSILIAGCYNDDELWDEVKGIKTELSQLKENLSNLQTIVSAYENAKFITNYEETDEGIKITFSDNKTIIVKHGEKGADAPVIGVKAEDGIYYWTITANGETQFLLVDGQKLRVTGAAPQLSVDTERILDSRWRTAQRYDWKRRKGQRVLLSVSDPFRNGSCLYSDKWNQFQHTYHQRSKQFLFRETDRRTSLLRFQLQRKENSFTEYGQNNQRRFLEETRRVDIHSQQKCKNTNSKSSCLYRPILQWRYCNSGRYPREWEYDVCFHRSMCFY